MSRVTQASAELKFRRSGHGSQAMPNNSKWYSNLNFPILIESIFELKKSTPHKDVVGFFSRTLLTLRNPRNLVAGEKASDGAGSIGESRARIAVLTDEFKLSYQRYVKHPFPPRPTK